MWRLRRNALRKTLCSSGGCVPDCGYKPTTMNPLTHFSHSLSHTHTHTHTHTKHTLAISYMTEILNSKSMNVSSGYDTLSSRMYWKGAEKRCHRERTAIECPQ